WEDTDRGDLGPGRMVAHAVPQADVRRALRELEGLRRPEHQRQYDAATAGGHGLEALAEGGVRVDTGAGMDAEHVDRQGVSLRDRRRVVSTRLDRHDV